MTDKAENEGTEAAPAAPTSFKKRRKRPKANMKAKTLDESLPTKEELAAEDEKRNTTEEKESSSDDEDGSGFVKRPEKKAKKENPFITSTKQKIRALSSHTWQSERSTVPDKSMNSDQVAVSIDKIERDQDRPKWEGPQKAPANVRTISRFDYQPDLCKDYNETGYCGYGDSCKFLHDRGDYKSGWQLEREFEEEQKRKRMMAMGEDVEEEEDYRIDPDEDDVPWACLICREDFDTPVVTQCKHYFCEKCALAHYVKNQRCFVCNENTHGVFNTAHRLLTNLEKLKTRRIEEAQKAEDMDKEKREHTSWAM